MMPTTKKYPLSSYFGQHSQRLKMVIKRWQWCLLFLVACANAESVANLFPEQAGLPPIPEGITVGAYYYPWHADDFHRDGGYLREELEPRHFPTLGEYDDRRDEVVAQHLAWSRQANINVWMCSWWGPNSREDNTIRNVIMKHSDLGEHHKIALLYESTGRIKKSEGYTLQRVQADIEHMCDNYFHDDKFYKINGKPVVALYLARLLHSQGVLANVTQIMRETARQHCNTEMYLLGDQVWGNAPQPGTTFEPFELLDAVTNYDIYGNMNHAPFAYQDAVDDYYDEQEDWRQRSGEHGVHYIPGVSPGYNDRGVRLEKDHRALSRRLTPESEPGTLFVAELLRARYLVNEDTGNLLLVNSFNEWHEDSQIEPCQGEPAIEPQDFTDGLTYEGYEDLYLNILRAATCDANCPPLERWTSPALQEDPFDGPPPGNVLVGAYYYIYHGESLQSKSSYLREQIDSQQPYMGHYDSADPFTIAKHLEWSRRANIGLWITPWWGLNTGDDQVIRNVVLGAMEDQKIALQYEIQSRFSESDNWNLDLVREDMEHICMHYFGEQNYFTSHGRPVLFLKLTRKWYGEGILEDVIEMIRTVATEFGYRPYIVGDHVWGEAPVDDLYLPFLELDAVTNFDVFGNMGTSGHAGQEAVDKYYQQQRDWRDRAWGSGCGFVPVVLPGFNGKARNPDLQVLARTIEQGDNAGSLFAASLEKARYLVDSDLSNLLVVNSFNDWYDDTQLEPVVGMTSTMPEELTEGFAYDGYGTLYLDILHNSTIDTMTDITPGQPAGKFQPLQCNVVASLSTKTCEASWTSLFGSHQTYNAEILIPCGECVVLDHPEPVIYLHGGLDIQGKLVIPDGYKVVIHASYIRVQGLFQIESTKVVDGQPDVRIKMMEGEPGIQKFQAASSNGYACGVQRCDPGPKSIFVAGGQLDFRGVPRDTITWVNALDVETHSPQPAFLRGPDCPAHGVFIDESFNGVSGGTLSFERTMGANWALHDSKLRIYDRTSTYHGVQWDVSSFRDCLVAGESYILSFQARVLRDGMDNVLTDCASLGKSCLEIQVDYFPRAGNGIVSSLKYQGPSKARFKYSEWMSIEIQVQFSQEELSDNNAFVALRLGGGEIGADIELKSFSLKQSLETMCSTEPAQCRNLVPCNGDAEMGFSQHPFSLRDESQLHLEVEDSGNHFWRVRRDESSTNSAGVEWKVPIDCMQLHAVYKFHMRFRVHPSEQSLSAEPSALAVYMRSTRHTGSNDARVVVCPESDGTEWVNCEGYFRISEGSLGDLEEVTMFFSVSGSTTSTYDVDDLSFEFVHMDGPVVALAVPISVEASWGVGAEILVTSHTLDWKDQQVRHIVSIYEGHQDGMLMLSLDQAIPRPASLQSDSFAVEVALLSRNVRFEGEGGHLTISHTPEVKQEIVGVEFREFGILNGNPARKYPINVDNSESIAGSTISQNSVQHSGFGCIGLKGTNDVHVEGNIAFDTVGHCYSLLRGTETGNIFQSNIGAKTRHAEIDNGNGPPVEMMGDDLLESAPATFLISNLNNTFERNIGAGSEGDAFTITIENNRLQASQGQSGSGGIATFRNNKAHSNQIRGVNLRVSSEYRRAPSKLLLEGLEVYRNAGTGLLISGGENVVVDGSTFCDNRGNIGVRRSNAISVKNTKVVGMSQEMEILESTQVGLTPIRLCPNRKTRLTGLEMDSFGKNREGRGLALEGTTFSGFSDVKICKEYAISVAAEVGWGAFDFFSTVSKVSMEEKSKQFNLCSSYKSDIRDVYLIDADSSLKPSQSTATDGTSSIVSEGSAALQFVPSEQCQYVEGLCYHYCENTCLRTVIFSIDPFYEGQLSLVVSLRRAGGDFVPYSGTPYYEPMGQSSHSFVSKGLYFYVTLPPGSYEAHFVDNDANRVWPTFVETTYSKPLCRNALVDGSVWLPPTQVLSYQCSDLIRNGYGDVGDISPWIAGPGGIIVPTSLEGSAFCDLEPSFLSSNPNAYSFGQYLDTRCLREGLVYRLEVQYKFIDKSTLAPVELNCTDVEKCPSVSILFTGNDGYSWFNQISPHVADDNIFAIPRGGNRKLEEGSTGMLTGKLVIDPEMASSYSAFFYVHRGNEDDSLTFCIDTVKLVLNNEVAL